MTDRLGSPHLIRIGLWRWTQGTGLERFELLRSQDGEWILRGTILTLSDHGPAEARYEVVCDDSWQTKRADISLLSSKNENDDGNDRVLQITSENGRWYENGHLNETVTGCVDIDLGWSPSTNTLPIRRLRLDIGQSSGPLTAAWVSFPDLQLRPLPQEYLRISERQYRYSSRGGTFIAQLEVDDEGLVLDYERFWQRVKQTN